MRWRSGSAHNFDLEACFIFKIRGVVVGASSVGVAIRVQRFPAVVRCCTQDAVNVGLGSSVKREVVDSRQPSVMCATREGWRSRGHEVDVTASPGGSVVPLLVDGPSEFHEKPAPGHASAVQVCDPNLNVMHTNCHIAIVPRAQIPLDGLDRRPVWRIVVFGTRSPRSWYCCSSEVVLAGLAMWPARPDHLDVELGVYSQ